MTQGVPHTTIKQVLLAKKSKQLYNKLYMIEHKDKYKEYSINYYKENPEKCHIASRECFFRTKVIQMRGLCHICFCSNVEIFNHKGQIICDSCLQDQLRDG